MGDAKLEIASFAGLTTSVVALGGWWLMRRRDAALRECVSTIGWRNVGSDPSLTRRRRGTPFGMGHSNRVSELVEGRHGDYQASSFAYRYATGHGRSRRSWDFHVVEIGPPTWLPTVQLTPEGST